MERITGYTTNELKFISTGLCPNCKECASIFDVSIKELNEGIKSGNLFDNGSFSWSSCDDCNMSLGSDRYIAHGIDNEGNLIHFSVCIDCLMELNGYTLHEDGDYI